MRKGHKDEQFSPLPPVLRRPSTQSVLPSSCCASYLMKIIIFKTHFERIQDWFEGAKNGDTGNSVVEQCEGS